MCFKLVFLIFFIFNSLHVSRMEDYVEKKRIKEDDYGDKSSIVFVFDTTGSMYNDLVQLKDGAGMILKTALDEGNFIADFVFVPFHDPAVGPATVTRDIGVFKTALNQVRVYGGGDCPEKSLGGIQLALNVSRPRSYIYVFTDATASDHKLVGKVLDSIQRKQSQVVFVLTGHCNDLNKPSYKVYPQIAAASSGQVFNLNKTSVHKVLDFVKTSMKSRAVNLGSLVNPAGYNHTQEIPVDSTLGEVTVSVSGAKPQLKVVNPSGVEITGPPQLVTTLDLSEIVVVKVLNPEPGSWSITVGSEDDYSVKVVGLSNLTFNHGFSVEKPKSMVDTSYRPLQGTYNYMVISLTEISVPVDIETAEILNLDGKPLFEIPLQKIEGNKQLYMTKFLPPDEMFYIAIKGHDEQNLELKRIGVTAVQVKLPDVPYLTAPKKVEAKTHEEVVLRCDVESLVPIRSMWLKDNSLVQGPIHSLQTTSIEYRIEDMGEHHVGMYRCVSKNSAGISDAYTELIMTVDPPQVNISIVYDEYPTVSCTAFSDVLLEEFKLLFNRSHVNNSYSTDIEIEPSVDGFYTYNRTLPANETENGVYVCLASNRGGQRNATAHINTTPIAQIIGPHTINKRMGTDLQLVCSTEHALSAHWVTPRGVILTEKPDETGSNRFRVSRYPVETGFNVVLDVRNVTEGGNFTCVASKGKRSVTDFVHINVVMKPEVRIEGAKNLTIVYGNVHRVVCKVRANPAPRIVWHRETERFLNNLITSTEENVYASILHLNNSAGMNATYFCIGENSEGIDQDSVVVNVRKKMTLLKGFTDESVQLYSQIELNCLVDSYPPARIKWYHNGTDLQTKDNVRISEDCTTVYIQRVEFSDLGLYLCEASNGFESVNLNGTLSVYGLEIPLLSKQPTKIVLQEGQPVNISCRIIKGNPEPTIAWQFRRDSSEDFTVLHRDVAVAEDRLSLEISNARIDYSGEYRCIAQNDVGSDAYNVELTVQFAPKLLQSNESDESNGTTVENKTPHLVEGGKKITFSCKAMGIPPPIVIWTKDRQPIHYSNNLYLTENNELIIEKADISNSGLYTCNATSVLGSTHKNFSLVVYVPPKIIEPGIEPEQEFLEGQLVELPCRAKGAPKPKLVWLHNGRPLTDVRKYIDQFGLRFVANLTDFGVYTCVASNQYGNTSSSFTVYIWVTPYIEPPLEITVEVLIGSNATLDCDAVGFPVPTIYWQFNGELLTENTTDLSFNDRGNVYIKNAKETQEGMYICVAENLAGVAYKHIQFNVNVPPTIISDNMTKYIATDMDTSLVVSCRATGKPKPYVLWIKDGIYIDKDSHYDIDFDGLLTIKQPSVDLSGSYICVAKNSLGSDNKTITIDIYSLPQTQAEQMQTTMTLLEGASVDIECPVRDKHNSQVQWYKEAKLVATGSLMLENVSRHSTSQYACVATNAVRSSYAVIGVNVEWPPRFVRHVEENFKLIKGEDVYLDCEVDAKPMARTKWLFNSKPILGEDSHRLKLLDVKLQNTGTYKCVVGNKHGTIYRSFILDVIVPPYISSFDLLDVKLKEGTKATLECNAVGSPEPKVTWTYNDTKWRANHTSLTIANVTSHSEGLYRCDATNEAGATHIVYRVDVVQTPVVRELVLYQHGRGVTLTERGEIVLGTKVRLSCLVNGKPTPRIKWIRNGATIGVNARDIHYADFLLNNVQIKDSGIYLCVASNEGGVVERRITLDVLEPPKIFQTLFDNSNSSNKDIKVEVISGQAYYMHCHPYGNPLPEIYWFKNGLPLRLFDETMISTDFGEILVSKRAFEEQSGNYTCVARNKVGETSIVYLVDVLVPPPEFKDSVKQISTRIGFTLNLTCPVEGTPVPNVMWFKQPYTEINELTPRTQLLNDNITLIINATETADTGRYTCAMTNKVGAAEFTYDVIVYKTPSIAGNVGNNNIETHTVSLKRSVVLKCEVDGHPMPMIKWLKDTQELGDKMSNVQRVLGNSLLTIWSATSRDGGQYICIAENNAGTAHRRYNVLVKVPGKWSEWSQWSYCNVTCGLGYQHKSRYCHYIDDYITIDKSTKSDKVVLDETVCKGPTIENRRCHMPPCEVEESQARWSIWSKWSQCSSSCGAGTQARTRRCRTRAKCYGDNVQIRKCLDLPKCDSAEEITENEVFGSKEEITEKNPYLPEATYELQPENIYSYNPDAEELHLEAAANPLPYFEVNVTENMDYSQRGPCEPGYRHNTIAGTCDDIDECLLENNHCHSTQLCANTVGGYRCSCPAGYLALGLGQRCLDINECVLERDACEFACVNVAGGYVCACPRPLRLHADRRRCVTPSPYRAQSYEELGNEEYLSANIDFPAKYMKNMKE